MCRKILLLSLFLFQTVHGMQTFQSTYRDGMKKIFEYAMWVEVKSLEGWRFGQPLPEPSNDAWHTIRRNYTLQLVSKHFKSVFWDCFALQEKDFVIQMLLRFNGKNKKSCNDLVDIAVSMQASLYPLLRHALCEKYNPACVRAILAIGDTDVINKAGSGVIDRLDDKSLNCLKTPLYLAIEMRHIDSAKLLLDYPMIDVNATFPLGEAVNKENVEVIKLLLTRSEIQVALSNDVNAIFLLREAVRKENVEIVKLLLAHPKIRVNAVNENGETALFVAVNSHEYNREFAKNSLHGIIALLIQAGIDTTVKNKNGYTAFDIACQPVQEMIKKALAKKNNL